MDVVLLAGHLRHAAALAAIAVARTHGIALARPVRAVVVRIGEPQSGRPEPFDQRFRERQPAALRLDGLLRQLDLPEAQRLVGAAAQDLVARRTAHDADVAPGDCGLRIGDFGLES